VQRTIRVPIDEVYVPAKRRKTLDVDHVESLAEAILVDGLKTPIMVRADKDRWVLVEGLHRLEALRALGERDVEAFHVQPRQH
jgi:ParB-like chromosome segregation protein Spo0J